MSSLSCAIHRLNLGTKGTSIVADGKCHLLEMTAEIRQKIWNYAVKEDKAIIPKQVKITSNKFWPYGPANAKVQAQVKDIQPPEPLITAVQLSLTCHQIYDEVAATGLFYQINDITFISFDEMLTYLVAITPIRKNAIRSITFDWNSYRWACKHAFTMLATCEGLRNLEAKLVYPPWGWRHFGVYDSLTELRGIENFKITVPDVKPERYPFSEDIFEERVAEMKKVGQEIAAVVKLPRVAPVLLKKIRAAEEASRLNIFGEGRLGPDKKPGIVASRTRGQLQKQKTLNDIGLIPETEEHPKFSKFGDLLWDIKSIADSRQLATDYGTPRVEVYVTWAAIDGQEVPPSWEILDRIVSTANVLRVARHYVKNPEAYDLGIAISTIKEFVEKEPETTLALESLAVVMKRNDSDEAALKARRLLRSRAFR
jgi:hypothetical protein